MKLGFLPVIFLSMSVFLSVVAQAQVSASSTPAIIDPVSTKEGLANGRYRIKKNSTGLESQRTPAQEDQNPVNRVSAAPEPQESEIKEEEPVRAPTLKEEAAGLIGPESQKILDFYKEQIHADDIRNNRIEIQGGPGLVYQGSSSNYSYRNYTSFFSSMDLSSNVWMMPSIGVNGRIMFSFGASLPGDGATSSRIPVKYEDIDLGVKFRRFFGLSRMASSVNFDFLYSESKLNAPADNTDKAILNSKGFGMKLSSRIPTSASYAWIFGGTFYPRLVHREDGVGISISSGTPSESTRLGLNIGAEVKFSRESQIVYDLSVSTERNTFTGTANPADAETGLTPTNVIVTNTLVMFTFGYRWGR